MLEDKQAWAVCIHFDRAGLSVQIRHFHPRTPRGLCYTMRSGSAGLVDGEVEVFGQRYGVDPTVVTLRSFLARGRNLAHVAESAVLVGLLVLGLAGFRRRKQA